MTLKRWMLGKVNEAPRAQSGGRVPPTLHGTPDASDVEPHAGGRESAHLGRYAPLIAAVRAELEGFVTNELRLHLAIAERDRYVLSSIEIDPGDHPEHRDLLQRFMREFKPEQIKQYLARDVIAGLRNASAIDLTQFAGLNAARDSGAEADDEFSALLADLHAGAPAPAERAYDVTLVGRWSEKANEGVVAAPAPRASAKARAAEGPHTPLAGRTFTLAIEDGSGTREITLDAVVPGRRYAIGKDPACDVPVDGTYASRRHCRIWWDKGAWWVQDAQSTNGIRVEASSGVRRQSRDAAADREAVLELPPGAALVLSAHADGPRSSYPRLVFRATSDAVVDAPTQAQSTLATPIAPARRALATWSIAAAMASGTQEAAIDDGQLPFRIGRSRNQTLVIDWTHSDVSGRHVEIVSLDEHGASVVVHGENGVSVAGVRHETGERFHWSAGDAMLLGRTDGAAPACTLTLTRAA